jgi:protein-S-isoprenylcysteine O-methyltransferase Ste14
MNRLLLRSVVAFLALPGMVAYVIPVWLLQRDQHQLNAAGLIVVLTGTGVLLWCVRDFYVAGKGTLAPWSPPRRLVTTGLYRISRNPMYVGVVLILVGWTLTWESRAHAWYTVVVMAVFYFRVVLFEEPWLARTHGDAWTAYRAQVKRRFVW